jgi:hypothetical protein
VKEEFNKDRKILGKKQIEILKMKSAISQIKTSIESLANK